MKRKKDQSKFAELMMSLAEVFDDGKGISPVKTEIYYKALEEFSIEDVEQAVVRTIKTRTFSSFPKPGEIRKEIEGDEEERALKAWVKVEWAVRHVGPYPSVKFDDPVIHSVIENMGGWVDFQEPGVFHPVWTQKEFIAHYRAIARSTNHPEHLEGIIEMGNATRGYHRHIKPPVYVEACNIPGLVPRGREVKQGQKILDIRKEQAKSNVKKLRKTEMA